MAPIQEAHTSNGVPIAVIPNPAMASITWSVWVGGGSRHEEAFEVGATHMLEHLGLSNGPERDSYATMADGLGGEANALTSKHHVIYFATVDPDVVEDVAARLIDDVMAPTITAESVSRERAIIDTELRSAAADPRDYVYERWAAEALGLDPFVRPAGGTPSSIASLAPEVIRGVHAQRLHSRNVRVLAAGATTLEQTLAVADKSRLIELTPGDWSPDKHIEPLLAPAEFEAAGDGDTGLTVVMLGGVGPGATEPAGFAAATILNALLGGSSASLFFRRIRLELALAYECQSEYRAYQDMGLWRAMIVVDADSVDRLYEESRLILRNLLDDLPLDELNRARREAYGRHQTGRDKWLDHMMWIGEALDAGWRDDIDATFIRHLREVDLDTIAATLEEMFSAGLLFAAAGDLTNTTASGRIDIA